MAGTLLESNGGETRGIVPAQIVNGKGNKTGKRFMRFLDWIAGTPPGGIKATVRAAGVEGTEL